MYTLTEDDADTRSLATGAGAHARDEGGDAHVSGDATHSVPPRLHETSMVNCADVCDGDDVGQGRVGGGRGAVDGDGVHESVPSSSALSLALAWDDTHTYSATPTAAVSMSNGAVCTASLRPTGLAIVSRWHAHDAEVWTVTFDPRSPSTVFTGADDRILKVCDVLNTKISSSHMIACTCTLRAGLTQPHNLLYIPVHTDTDTQTHTHTHRERERERERN